MRSRQITGGLDNSSKDMFAIVNAVAAEARETARQFMSSLIGIEGKKGRHRGEMRPRPSSIKGCL